MASVPADPNANLAIVDSTAVSTQANESDLMAGLNRLSVFKQLGLMIGLAGSVALGFALVLWLQEPNYQPLMHDLAAQDMEEVSRILNMNCIQFKVDPNSGVMLIESKKLYDAKIKLAAAGITSDRNVGYEILDKDQGLGTSQFIESTNFKRGLEGELSRTIASFRNVRNARVHLAIPKRSVFVRDSRQPTASVLVETSRSTPLTREQVDAIVNLVAGSVSEMDRSQVTVVDQKGNLLSRNDESEADKLISREFEYSRKIESVLNNRIASILDPVLGTERFRSEVSAEVDFTAVEETEELYNPDMQVLRSEQTLDEQRQTGQNGGVPGALANQPPAAGNAPELAAGAGNDGAGGGGTNLRKQSTRNYEVDRTVSYTRHQQGRLKRLTVAVAVDDIRNIDAETGEVSYSSWDEAEIERLTLLVRNAVGFSAARGDSVNVINTPFAPVIVEPFVEPEIWEQEWFFDTVWRVSAILMAVILIFAVVRPVFKNLATSGAELKEFALAGDAEGLAQIEGMSEGEASERVSLGASDEFLLPGASEGYDKQVNALKGLVAEDPARVAQVIRQWVGEDG
jgi:flagellar M-ring protein FliF